MSDKKAGKQLIAQLREAGYTVQTKGRDHPKVTKPGNRGVVFLNNTPSDHRAHKNSLADLYRVFGFRPAGRA